MDIDPNEVTNLLASGNPKHREALIRLRAALDIYLDRGDRDGGEFPNQPR